MMGIGGTDPALAAKERGGLGGGRPAISLPPDATNTLFVEGLPSNCSRREVAHIFRPFVSYKEVRLVNKESRHVLCFVDFESPAEAATAKDALQGDPTKEHPSPLLPLEGRVAIVTGGSRGIGRAISLHLRSLGAKIIINYASNSNQADQLASELNSSSDSNHVAVAVQANISDPDQVKLLFDRAEQEFGTDIHILVHSAGVMDPKYPSLVNTTIEDWDMIFNVNARGAFLCSREGANRLKRGGGGRIIMISTSLVGASQPGYGAYTASKAAVESMVKILAKELKGSGITANCVAPGPVATELFFAGKTEEMVKRFADGSPLGRLGEPKDVAQAVGFLASDAGEWVNGQVVRVNGGFIV